MLKGLTHAPNPKPQFTFALRAQAEAGVEEKEPGPKHDQSLWSFGSAISNMCSPQHHLAQSVVDAQSACLGSHLSKANQPDMTFWFSVFMVYFEWPQKGDHLSFPSRGKLLGSQRR